MEIMVIDAKERSVAFDGFPLSEALYAPDVWEILEQTILNYGLSEWRAAVLTNELHGHLGIYSLLGVKMGIFALEHFPAGDEPLEVCSLAGTTPPLSCLNDGLQVATGATLGHGNIRICNSESPSPEAHFRRGKRTVKLCLCSSVAQQIAHDVEHGREKHGLHNPAYWSYVRHLAIHYWATLDRHQIFELRSMSNEQLLP